MKIEVLKTLENNYSVKVNDNLLHSKYYPSKQAEKFIDNIKENYINKERIVVYGLGFGYHISELLKIVSSNCEINVFDINEDIFKQGNKLKVYEELLNNKNIKLYIGYSKDTLIKLSNLVKKTKTILIYKPCLKTIPNEYSNFKISLMGFQIGIDNMDEFNEMALKNKENNENINAKSINEFFKLYSFENQPIIIVSAGPSLDNDIGMLKKLNKKVKIFCVGSALKTLMSNNIKPDMICIIDASEMIVDQIKEYKNLDIPLCFLSTASRWAVNEYKGPKFIFYNEENKDNTIIETGKSVATAAFSIALKGKANTIIFVGQDLAFKGNLTHTKLFPHKNITSRENQREKVEGVNGEILNTTPQLMYYKNWFENRIKDNNNVEFINCSHGARIIGTKEMPLEEVYKKYAGK